MGSNDPNYYTVDVPQGKDPEDYTYVERRAEILGLILERGSPHGIKQARLADRYDVSESQISQDMDRLRKHVDNHLGRQAKLTTRAAYQDTVEALRDEGEHYKAWKVIMEWNEWLQDLGKQETAPEQHEISGELEHDTTEKKMFVGLDLGDFPGVDPDNVVGADFNLDEGPQDVDVEAAEDLEAEAQQEGSDGT